MSGNPSLGEASAALDHIGADQAKAEADRIMSDTDGAYWDSGHRRHEETVARVTGLLGEVHGNAAAVAEDGQSQAFHDNIGRILQPPADPGDYDFKEVIALGDGQEWDSDLAEEAAYWASVGELPKEEAQAFARRYQEIAAFDDDVRIAMRKNTEQGLQRHWGNNYERNVAACNAVISSLGSEFQEFLNTSGLGDDYNMALTLYRIAQNKGFVL